MLSRRRFLTSLAAVSVVAIAGCAPKGEGKTYTVTMRGPHQFEPSSLEIPVGSTVVWTNLDSRVHTVTADPALAENAGHVVLPEGVDGWDSGDLFPGATYRYTFSKTGDYLYFSRYDEGDGMLGRVTVYPAETE